MRSGPGNGCWWMHTVELTVLRCTVKRIEAGVRCGLSMSFFRELRAGKE